MVRRPPPRLLTYWPELAATAVLLATVQWIFLLTMRKNDGTFTYCLDDAYIHLAVAKNIVLHHVWGATQFETSSPSSSPLWTVLLVADFLIQGVNTGAPLIMNLVAAALALAIAARCWRRAGWSQPAVFLLCLCVLFAIPLPTVIFDGMEHSLHVLLVFLWIDQLDLVLRTDAPIPSSRVVWLAVLAALLAACRYESLLLILMTCGVVALRRQLGAAVAIGLGGLSLVSLYGAYTLSHGLHFLPDSVLMKAPARDFHSAAGIMLSLGGGVLRKLAHARYLAAMLVAAIALLRMPGDSWKRSPRAIVALFIATLLLHLEFARIEWFYRYEAYLIGLGVLALGLGAAPFRGAVPIARRTATAVAVVVAAFFAPRTAKALNDTPEAAKNIYDQQFHMAMFAATSGAKCVGLFDMGFVAFASDVHLMDLGGLASPSVANERLRHGKLTRESIDRLGRELGVELIMIHDREWPNQIPASWHLIGQWKTPPPIVILGGDVLSFYATNRIDVLAMKRRLAEFSAHELPAYTQVWIPGAAGTAPTVPAADAASGDHTE